MIPPFAFGATRPLNFESAFRYDPVVAVCPIP